MSKHVLKMTASVTRRLLRYKRIAIIALLLPSTFVTYSTLTGSAVLAAPYGAGSYGGCTYGDICSISLATSGALNLSLVATSSGVYSIQKDIVVVETKNPLGYSLALESNSASSADLINGASALTASSGTPSAPTPLSLNTWGYRLDSVANFGAGPTSATTNAADNSLSFAGLPLKGFPQTAYSQNGASAIGGDTINIWYGIRANNVMPSGSYQQTIIYTAVATP